MTRQILRFPVGQQFRKILEDDHEWFILTDMHLKVLAANRGGMNGISLTVINKTYKDLIEKTPPHILRIFSLHTHPYSMDDGKTDKMPSQLDMNFFIRNKLFNLFGGVIEMGAGVITKEGIFIVKFPENKNKLMQLDGKIQDKYREGVRKHLKNELGCVITESAEHQLKTLPQNEQNKLLLKTHSKAFRELVKEEPDIRIQTVRRTHRGTMRRWRR